MAKLKAQGTELYFVDPEDNTILEVSCVTGISGLDTTIEELETTCLANRQARTYTAGLGTPGTATLEIQFDPEDPSNMRLYELYNERADVEFLIGLSDGEAPPTFEDDELTLPADRSWLVFGGYVSAFPWDFSLNSMVTNSLSVRVSDQPQLVARTTP